MASTVDTSTSSTVSLNGSSKTNNGTPIVKSNGNLDKNSFLKILVAELSNQDPTQQKDSTQYIAQLAQFSSLEQMTNLNSNVSFSGATSLLGKTVLLNGTNSTGGTNMGTVKGVSKNGDTLTVSVQLMDDKGVPETDSSGNMKLTDFNYTDVIEVASVDKASTTTPTTTTTATS